MKEITRENFRYLAAGRFVYGKGNVDAKHLEIYTEGALMAWDFLVNGLKKEKENGIEKGKENETGPQLDSATSRGV